MLEYPSKSTLVGFYIDNYIKENNQDTNNMYYTFYYIANYELCRIVYVSIGIVERNVGKTKFDHGFRIDHV